MMWITHAPADPTFLLTKRGSEPGSSTPKLLWKVWVQLRASSRFSRLSTGRQGGRSPGKDTQAGLTVSPRGAFPAAGAGSPRADARHAGWHWPGCLRLSGRRGDVPAGPRAAAHRGRAG